MKFAHLPFLPLLDSASQIPPPEKIKALSTITPFLVSLSVAELVIPLLPSQTERYVYDDLVDLERTERCQSIIRALDLGSIKVVTELRNELLELGVPAHRIISKVLATPNQDDSLQNRSEDIMLISVPISSTISELSLQKHSAGLTTFVFDPTTNLNFVSILSNRDHFVHVISSSALMTIELDHMLDLFISRLRTDRPDGLFTTSVVSSSPSSTLVGQVYSSPESIKLSIKTQKATYFSRSRNQLWVKGATSGATQSLLRIRKDCDGDALEFHVIQKPSTGFCHTEEVSCFGPSGGLTNLESILLQRRQTSTPGSYTNRLFSDERLLKAKIMEEAEELCDAGTVEDVAGEMADLIYFALCRCISKGVTLADVERVLDARSSKITRRKGDAKPKWEAKIGASSDNSTCSPPAPKVDPKAAGPINTSPSGCDKLSLQTLRCQSVDYSTLDPSKRSTFLTRPLSDCQTMVDRVKPIVEMVKSQGDAGLNEAVRKFDKFECNSSTSLILRSPFSPESLTIPHDVKQAIDVAYNNIYAFHMKQRDKERTPMVVETMGGVVCSRFARAIDRVGLYVPGGTAVLPSTALMLAIPAQVAGCPFISIATPPRADGTISPEIMYIASKCGVQQIVKAGGAHAISALSYGTETVQKVDKIFGPGNQFVTAAKMMVASDLQAQTAIDMPAGPSEVLVIADQTCSAVFVAADLLSQAEHGPDSQVILLAIDLTASFLREIEEEINRQALLLPRLAIVQQSIPKSFIVKVSTVEEAFEISNEYAPEHLILHISEANQHLDKVRNAGSVFVGTYSPESCGDYASGTNHSLPTAGFAKQYSGVSTMGFMKHITSQELSLDGLKNLGPTVIRLAELEGLEAHASAVRLRLASLNGSSS